MSSAANAINATLYDRLNFNFIRDTTPISGILRVPHVIVVHPSFSAKTLPEFIAYAKANPGKLTWASPGVGTAGHVCGELFKMMASLNMVHVPYRGGGPAMADLLSGQLQVYIGAMTSSLEYVKANRLRALAVSTTTRSEARAALLRTRMTDDEYLKQGDQQLMYEQLFGAVASLCMSGYTPDDIVPALIRHAVELAVMEDVTAAVAEDAAALINILNFRCNDHKAERAEESVTVPEAARR